MTSSARHSRPSAARLAEFEQTWRGKFAGLSVEWTENRCRMTNPETGIAVEVYVFAGSHQPVSDFDQPTA